MGNEKLHLENAIEYLNDILTGSVSNEWSYLMGASNAKEFLNGMLKILSEVENIE